MLRHARQTAVHAIPEGTGDMTDHTWQRSSFCSGGGNNCVEVAADGSELVALRESTSPALVITTNQAALRALVCGVKAGRFTPAQG